MAAWIPLLQTFLWVGLIIWLIRRYNTQVVAVLASIQERIAKGSSVKAGPFELGQDIRPQDVQQQKERLKAEEIEQLGEGSQPARLLPPKDGGQLSLPDFRQRYLLAEDLVMRELQAEFGVVVNRQMRIGDVYLDGMFAKDGVGYGIEVKYVLKPVVPRLVDSLTRLQNLVRQRNWRRFTLILALVCETNEPIAPSAIDRIQSDLSKLDVPTMLRVYTLRGLAEKFGVETRAT